MAQRDPEQKALGEGRLSWHVHIEWIVEDWIGVLGSANPVESCEVQQQLESAGFTQVVTVRQWPFTMAWRLPDSNLRNFMVRVMAPKEISPADLLTLQAFCVYELRHGRRVAIWFADDRVGDTMVEALREFFATGRENLNSFLAEAPAIIRGRHAALPHERPRRTGCRYCHEGVCCSDLVCHGTTIEKAVKVINTGAILSACRARGVPGKELAGEPDNLAGDPPDYFDYVMWAGGNCTGVDHLVWQRVMGRPPDWAAFEATFQPAVKFFFRSRDLDGHPRMTFDGVHAKIRGQLELIRSARGICAR